MTVMEETFARIRTQCFQSLPTIQTALGELCVLSHRFCEMVVAGTHADVSELVRVFHRTTPTLFRTLHGVENNEQHAHLGQLLLRIDNNRFFTRSGTSSDALLWDHQV